MDKITEKQNEAAREFIKTCYQQILETENDVVGYGFTKDTHYQTEHTYVQITDNIRIKIEKTVTKNFSSPSLRPDIGPIRT